MEAAHDVKFRRPFRHTLSGACPDFLQREGIGPGGVRRAAKGTQLAVRHANVRRIDVPVDVEIADLSVSFLPYMIRKPSDGQEVRRLKERHAIFGVQAFAGENFLSDWLKAGVGNLEFGHLRSEIRWPGIARKRSRPHGKCGSSPEKQEQ